MFFAESDSGWCQIDGSLPPSLLHFAGIDLPSIRQQKKPPKVEHWGRQCKTWFSTLSPRGAQRRQLSLLHSQWYSAADCEWMRERPEGRNSEPIGWISGHISQSYGCREEDVMLLQLLQLLPLKAASCRTWKKKVLIVIPDLTNSHFEQRFTGWVITFSQLKPSAAAGKRLNWYY